MTPEEFHQLVDTERSRFESQISVLRQKVERHTRLLASAEQQLKIAQEEYAERITAISRTYAGLPVDTSGRAQSNAVSPPRSSKGKRPKGSIDLPILRLAQELSEPDCTIADVMRAWKIKNGSEVTRSTVRRIFERYNGQSVHVMAQGTKGNANPTRYVVFVDDSGASA
jgi:hypothetical protein